MVAASELSINTSASALDMAEAIFGAGVTVTGATYTGAASASGIYSGGTTTSPGVIATDSGVILSTGQATDFTNSTGSANQTDNTSTIQETPGDAQLTAISGFETFDASILECTFVPEGDTLSMQIVFSSEEYLEYVGTQFNDACAVWVNGVQAELTVGTGDITINNVNDTSNSNLYIDNPQATDPFNTEMDGFTITLTLKAPVIPDQENTIKIGIADAGDQVWDSNLLIMGDSVQVDLIAADDHVEVGLYTEVDVDLLANDTSSTGSTLTITQINGQPVVAGSEVTLGTGETLIVNDDGTITVQPGDELGENTLTYTVEDEDGNSDVAFVTIKTVPCFTRGTLIRTARGDVPVETLEVGDRVVTRDHGLQPVRWIGRRKVPNAGRFRPVTIEAGTFGDHARLTVSPQHRVLLRRAEAQLAMADPEVLVRAAHLVNGSSVRQSGGGGEVEYFHLLFDRHEIVWSNGLETESFHPGAQTMGDMDEGCRDEIHALFPEIDTATGDGYGPSARMDLRRHEARTVTPDA